MTDLMIHNSLSGVKEKFTPLDPAHVRVYACGPTVYNYAHIGNARMAVVFDQLARLLRVLYPKVTYVSNITDIEDKIIAAARESGQAIETITKKYTSIYNEDMAALGVQPPDVQPLATGHVGEMIALIETLIARGMAYEKDGHVLFNVPAYAAYGRLSGRARDEQIAGARVEVAPYKKDPADFVLWKPSSGDQPGWDSPWGHGRPGWHIECSAMAEKHLGLPFDIHGGGADLKFPHHENEIAQSCGAHDLPPEGFAQTWMHNGFVTVEGEKMSKSLGNIVLVHDLIDEYPGEVLRLTLLSAHYRQPLDWAHSTIRQSRQVLDNWYRALLPFRDGLDDVPPPQAFIAALADDLNTPKAIAALGELRYQVVHAPRHEEARRYAAQLRAAGALMGVLHADPEAWFGYGQKGDAAIDALLAEREAARRDRNFARADEIRDELLGQGIVIEDTPDGPQWRRAG